MDRLGATQLDLLARHRARSLDLLLPASAAYGGDVRLRDTPDGKAILAQPPDMLVSVAISAAAAAVERRRLESAHGSRKVFGFEAVDTFPAEVLSMLRRRRLPFSPGDVRLLLDLGTFDAGSRAAYRAVARAVVLRGDRGRAAPRRGERARAPLLVALERAGQAIDALGARATSDGGDAPPPDPGAHRRPTCPAGCSTSRFSIRATPGRSRRRRSCDATPSAGTATQALVALFARARSTRPTEAWRREAAAIAARYEGLGELLRGAPRAAHPDRSLLVRHPRAALHGFSRPTTRCSPGARSGRRRRSTSRGSSRSSGSSLSAARRRRRTPAVTIALSRTWRAPPIEALGMIGTPEADARAAHAPRGDPPA